VPHIGPKLQIATKNKQRKYWEIVLVFLWLKQFDSIFDVIHKKSQETHEEPHKICSVKVIFWWIFSCLVPQ